MAQGDSWQLGIHVPLRNSKFDDFTQQAFFKAAVSSGKRIFTVDKNAADIDLRTADYVVVPGVEITLGPSNASGYEGAVETITVDVLDQSGSTYFFDATQSMRYDYAAGDAMTFRTHPVGWTAYRDYGYLDSRRYSRQTTKKYGSDLITFGAGHSFRIERTTSSYLYTHGIYRTTDIGTFLADNGVHRASVWAKSASTFDYGYAIMRVDEYDAANVYIANGETVTVDPGGTWTLKSGTFTPSSSSTSRARIDLQIESGIPLTQAMDFYKPVLEHAYGTSGDSVGYYEATEFPEAGSINYDVISGNSSSQLFNNSSQDFDASGGRIRWYLTADFVDVNQATYDNFMQLERACVEGKQNIVFRPNIDDLPPVMIGKIKLSNKRKSFWNYAYRSFSFRFEETE